MEVEENLNKMGVNNKKVDMAVVAEVVHLPLKDLEVRVPML